MLLSTKRVSVAILLGLAISVSLGPIANASKHRVQRVKTVKVAKNQITGRTTENARITILSLKNKRLASGRTNTQGKFKIRIKHSLKSRSFKFKVTKKILSLEA